MISWTGECGEVLGVGDVVQECVVLVDDDAELFVRV